MNKVKILHKGWRANDTLLECPSGYILTYFTHTKQKGVASFREGLFLYKNSRVFTRRHEALGLYMKRLPKRWQKYILYTHSEEFFERFYRGEEEFWFDVTEEQIHDVIYKRGKAIK